MQEWQKSSEEADEKAKATLENHKQIYNQHSQALPDPKIGNDVAIQNPKIQVVGHPRVGLS